MGAIIVRFNFDRWEVIQKYGYRETLLSTHKTEAEALDDLAFRCYTEWADQCGVDLWEGEA